jgi:hypothetical protein
MRWIIICTLLAACGDNGKAKPADAGIDTPTHLKGCLDTPSVPMAPTGQLPCDLIPPGLEL